MICCYHFLATESLFGLLGLSGICSARHSQSTSPEFAGLLTFFFLQCFSTRKPRKEGLKNHLGGMFGKTVAHSSSPDCAFKTLFGRVAAYFGLKPPKMTVRMDIRSK